MKAKTKPKQPDHKIPFTLKERRYRALARRQEIVVKTLVRMARELGRIEPQMRRYEREFFKTGVYRAMELDGYEQAGAVFGPRRRTPARDPQTGKRVEVLS